MRQSNCNWILLRITTIGMSIFLPHKTFANQICIQFNTVLHANFCDKVFLGGSVEVFILSQKWNSSKLHFRRPLRILKQWFLSAFFSQEFLVPLEWFCSLASKFTWLFRVSSHSTFHINNPRFTAMNFSPIGQKIHRKTLRILIVQVC